MLAQGVGGSTVPRVTSPDDDRLNQLADAYGVPSNLDAVTDAIISRSRPNLTHGANERNPVMNVVALLVNREGLLAATAANRPWPEESWKHITEVVARSNPPIGVENLIGAVLADVHSVLSQVADSSNRPLS